MTPLDAAGVPAGDNDNAVLKPAAADALSPSSREQRRVLSPAGRYVRALPFHLDLDRALPATAAAMREYCAATVTDHQPVVLHTLPEALVCGQGAVVTRNREIVHESVLEFTAHHGVPDGFSRAGEGYHLAAPATRQIDGPSLLLKRPWFRNFGHWLVDSAALLALLAAKGAAEGTAENLTIVVGDVGSSPLRAVMEETIRCLTPSPRVLFHPDHETWRFQRLHYVTPVHVPPLFKLPAALSALRDAILPDWSGIQPFRKIFVVRGTQPHPRMLRNSKQVVEVCSKRGYTCVAPDKLPLRMAARVFAEAKAVIGVKGAALTNAIFCRPGAALMALSPADFPDPFFWDLTSGRDIHYGEVFGPILTACAQSHNDFAIEPERLIRLLDTADHLHGTQARLADGHLIGSTRNA